MDVLQHSGSLPLGLDAGDLVGDVLQRLGQPSELWRVGLNVSKARWSSPDAEIDHGKAHLVFRRQVRRIRAVVRVGHRNKPGFFALRNDAPTNLARRSADFT